MRFEALELALDTVRLLAKILPLIRKHDGKLAGHIRDAANSFVLNLEEGNRRLGRDRIHLWSISSGSAGEVRIALRCAPCWGYFK